MARAARTTACEFELAGDERLVTEWRRGEAGAVCWGDWGCLVATPGGVGNTYGALLLPARLCVGERWRHDDLGVRVEAIGVRFSNASLRADRCVTVVESRAERGSARVTYCPGLFSVESAPLRSGSAAPTQRLVGYSP